MVSFYQLEKKVEKLEKRCGTVSYPPCIIVRTSVRDLETNIIYSTYPSSIVSRFEYSSFGKFCIGIDWNENIIKIYDRKVPEIRRIPFMNIEHLQKILIQEGYGSFADVFSHQLTKYNATKEDIKRILKKNKEYLRRMMPSYYNSD